MKLLRDSKGVALVTSLMFTVICLVISMYLLYMVTAGIKASGSMKKYRTALDAAYGGADIMAKDLLVAGFAFKSYSGASYVDQMKTGYMNNLGSPFVSTCLRTKLTKPRSQWGACADSIESAKFNPDISFDLNATSPSPFTVYSKIVDTMQRRFLVLEDVAGTKTAKTISMAGNTDESGTDLDYGSTTDAGGVTVPHYPYIYRVEVQGERKVNPNEKSKLSVVYAY